MRKSVAGKRRMSRWQAGQPAGWPLQQLGGGAGRWWGGAWRALLPGWRALLALPPLPPRELLKVRPCADSSGAWCSRSASSASARSRASITRPKPSRPTRSLKPAGLSRATAALTSSMRMADHTATTIARPSSAVLPAGSIVSPKATRKMLRQRWERPILLVVTELLAHLADLLAALRHHPQARGPLVRPPVAVAGGHRASTWGRGCTSVREAAWPSSATRQASTPWTTTRATCPARHAEARTNGAGPTLSVTTVPRS
mmetsp:Transcript_7336/g.20699  ORF Transcript_7336/g.20699 Transcript_7336/m.20699 type:complete len:258 (+) Transcript_7336:1505-2278(+)